MQQKSDEILMADVKAGDTEALGELYERYRTQLFTYFLRASGDRNVSNDLMMNTFERIYKYRRGYKETAPFRPWFFRIANNLIKDHFKFRKRYTDVDSSDINLQESVPVEMGNERRRYPELYRALDKLKPRDRRIITQYYLLELPYKDIALMEDISVNTARISVCRTLKQLNSLLKNRNNEY